MHLRRAAAAIAGLALAYAAVAGTLPLPATPPPLHVDGNHFVSGSLNSRRPPPIRLLGVNRSGTEHACIQGFGTFDGPTDLRSIDAMKSWGINTVRVPLNEDCWLGANNVDPRLSGDSYHSAIAEWVRRLNEAGLYVILDLHLAGPGTRPSTGIIPMPDADHAPAFWRSVATYFRSNGDVAFDLYNEPHDVDWTCWRDGCLVPGGTVDGETYPSYQAAGMQQLVDAVRSTGARQPILAAGLQFALDLSQWTTYRPNDPLHQLAASVHTYGYTLAPCSPACEDTLATIARDYPVVVSELGETDCKTGYIEPFMRFADQHGLSYLGWTWNAVAKGSWSCTGSPSLIKSYDGSPTGFGVGLRDHLRGLPQPPGTS
jgi:endoglucanase